MIDVIFTKRAERDENRIASYLWENLPSGNDEEVRAAVRIIKAERAKVARAGQGRSYPQDQNTGLAIHHGLPDHLTLSVSPYIVPFNLHSGIQSPHETFRLHRWQEFLVWRTGVAMHRCRYAHDRRDMSRRQRGRKGFSRPAKNGDASDSHSE